MREILFRGKSIDGKWRDGMLAVNRISNGDIEYSIYNIPKPNDLSEGKNCYCGVDENTIGQYAGLKDCNGTKIFEGDIIMANCAWKEFKKKAVVFEDGTFKLEGTHCLISERTIRILCMEVVGNIYDNPELLEGGKL